MNIQGSTHVLRAGSMLPRLVHHQQESFPLPECARSKLIERKSYTCHCAIYMKQHAAKTRAPTKTITPAFPWRAQSKPPVSLRQPSGSQFHYALGEGILPQLSLFAAHNFLPAVTLSHATATMLTCQPCRNRYSSEISPLSPLVPTCQSSFQIKSDFHRSPLFRGSNEDPARLYTSAFGSARAK
eukprot:1158139-Pelagomonas_calceolata.AAC.8